MGKRGQVTQFIIIGLILLFAVGLFILVQEIIKKSEQDIKPPPSFEPLFDVVDRCFEDNLYEGLQILGTQGGYINITPEMRLYGRYLSLYDEAKIGIPYWYYDGENHNPTIQSMEIELENFIEDNMDICIQGYGNLSEEYNVKKLADHEADVVLGAEDVSATLQYPIEASLKRTGEKWKKVTYRTSVPIRLRKLYELALIILQRENQDMFLENTIFDLMSISPDIPITNVMFKCSPFTKNIITVRDKIKGLANYNFPDIKINNTKTSDFIPGDKTYANARLVWDIGPEAYDYSDIAVQFDYRRDWPMLIQASPSRGGILRAEPMKIFDLVPTCYLQYHFTYDLNFPVKVSLFDPEGIKNQLYRFDFAFPVMLNHNRGDRVNAPIVTALDIPAYGGAYCDEYPKDEIDIRIINRVTFEDINHVDVWSRCGPYECYLGETTPTDSQYMLRAQVPRCKFAEIYTEKQGYTSIDTTIDTTNVTAMDGEVMPLKRISIEAVKRNINTPQIAEYLAPGEFVTVTFTNHEYGYQATAAYPVENMSYIELFADWNYEYEVEAYLIRNDTLLGGYHINWSVPWREFYFANNIGLSVVYDPAVETDEEAQYNMFVNLVNYSKKIKEPKLNQG